MNLMLEPTLLKKSTWHPSIGLEEPLHKHLNLVIPPFLQFCMSLLGFPEISYDPPF
jgi:hypothetical protein